MSNMNPRAVAVQAQRIENAERQARKLQDLLERQLRIIDQENAKMDQLIKDSQEAAARTGMSSTDPPLSSSAPNSFQSQFDQFSSTPSNKRLESISPEVFREAKEVLEPADNSEPSTDQMGNRHWDELNEDPGVQVYVSGTYPRSKSDKEYEYKVRPDDLPISTGEVRQAPVHPQGQFFSGRSQHEHYMDFKVGDIYEKEQFHPYHYNLA